MTGMIEYRENKNQLSSVQPDSPTYVIIPADRGQVNAAIWQLMEDGVPVSKANFPTKAPKTLLEIDGDTYAEYKTPDVIKLLDYYGETSTAGFLPVLFSDPSRDSLAEEQSTSLIPMVHNNVKMALELGENISNPSLKQFLETEGLGQTGRAFARRNPAQAAHMIIDHYDDVININSQGDGTPTRFEYAGGGKRVKAIHFEGGNITRVRILINDQEKWDFRTVEHLNSLLNKRLRVPQADTWHIDFEALSRTVNGAFSPVIRETRVSGGKTQVVAVHPQRMDIELYTSDQTNVRMLAEKYDTPPVIAASA